MIGATGNEMAMAATFIVKLVMNMVKNAMRITNMN